MITPEKAEGHAITYGILRENYLRFSEILVSLLKSLLSAEDVDYVSISGRAKEVASFQEKLTREGKDYIDPFQEVTDLCGIRIVAYGGDDLQRIEDLILENFTVDREHSVDKSKTLDPDRFGYLSRHYIIELSDERKGLREYKDYSALRAEVQIRTTLQHAWAALDHKLRYSSKQEIPRELRRRLYRISALLEMADDEFERLKKDISDLRESYAKDVEAGNLEVIEIDADSLEEFFGRTSYKVDLQAIAVGVGFALAPPPPNQRTPWTGLVRTLNELKVVTLAQLDLCLNKFKSTAQDVLNALAQRWKVETASPRLVLDPSTLIRIAVLFSVAESDAIGAMRLVRFGPSLQKIIENELTVRMSRS